MVFFLGCEAMRELVGFKRADTGGIVLAWVCSSVAAHTIEATQYICRWDRVQSDIGLAW